MLRRMPGVAFALILFSAELAAAVPVTYRFDSIAYVAFNATLVNAPIVGSGDLEFDSSGNLLSGTLTLPPGAFLLDVDFDGQNDVEFDLLPNTQTLAAASRISGVIDLVGGSVVGGSTCTVLPAAPPGTTCTGASGGGAPFGAGTSVATLAFSVFNSPTDFSGTITWVFEGATGPADVTRSFSFATVPEPSLAALLAVPLALAWRARRRRG